MLTCRWILAVLVITSVVGVTVVSAVRVASVRIIPSYGTIKVISAVNTSISIHSYGIINYETENFHKGEQATRNSSCLDEEGLKRAGTRNGY